MSADEGHQTRVLILIKGLGLGGAERLIADAAPVWSNEFAYHVAYVLPWKDQLAESVRSSGAPVTCIGNQRGMGPTTALKLRSLVSEWSPDIIHSHLPSTGVLARLSTSGPHVYTEHNLADSYRQPTRTLNRSTYGRNHAVIAVSDAVAESIAEFPGPSPTVINNGVGATRARSKEDVRAELGINGSIALVVHVGNIRPHKGHMNLISAVRTLKQQIEKVLVVSIGVEKNPGDLERVRAAAAAEGVEDVLRFLGRRDDARSFIGAADAVVNPSDAEGLPIAILEGLAFARPVVATDVGGVATVLRDEETGLLVEPRDPVALGQALARALTDPAAPEWGRAGAELVNHQHGIEQMVRRYEVLYRDVLSG